jgi:hypothetical protein
MTCSIFENYIHMMYVAVSLCDVWWLNTTNIGLNQCSTLLDFASVNGTDAQFRNNLGGIRRKLESSAC